jgi:hypothetical protein
MKKIAFYLSAGLGVIGMVIIISIISGWILSVLWNYFAPELFNAPIINHKQMTSILLWGWFVKSYFTISYKVNNKQSIG